MRKIQLGRTAFFAFSVGFFPVGALASAASPSWVLPTAVILMLVAAGSGLAFANRDCPRCRKKQSPRGTTQSRPSTVVGFECPHCGLRVVPWQRAA